MILRSTKKKEELFSHQIQSKFQLNLYQFVEEK